MPRNLVLLVGPPGSGKSTLAKEYETKFYDRISQDDQGKQEHIQKFLNHLKYEDDIIVDRMNFNKEQRQRYLKPAEDAGYTTKIIILHENRETCLARCKSRKDHPTIKDEQNAQSALDTFFSKYERVEDGEANFVERLWPKTLDPCIVSDLDGTLCNIDHRLHYFKDGKKNWKGFFKDISKDTPNYWCQEILERMPYKIVYCSGRPENYRKETEQWLNTYELPKGDLYMRHRQDSRKDSIAKEIIYEFEIKTRYNVYFVIDDRQQVCDMWRKHGLVCLQCAPGDF